MMTVGTSQRSESSQYMGMLEGMRGSRGDGAMAVQAEGEFVQSSSQHSSSSAMSERIQKSICKGCSYSFLPIRRCTFSVFLCKSVCCTKELFVVIDHGKLPVQSVEQTNYQVKCWTLCKQWGLEYSGNFFIVMTTTFWH